MSKLDELRAQIDDIDAQMIALFEKRMDVTRQVGEYKKENDLPVLDRKREEEVLAKKEAMLKNKYLKTEVKDFFSSIMAISRRQQRALMADQSRLEHFETYKNVVKAAREPVSNPRVYYQGVAGAYAEEATALFFGEEVERSSALTWRDLFELLMADKADYIVVPIENNSTGSINAVYDLLAEYGTYVVGEQMVKVDHCLSVLPGTKPEEITDVYSHEQGFFQSEEFLAQHSGWKRNAVLNTAAAAQLVQESGDHSKAAICSRRAAQLHGLEVLEEGINTSKDNYTRFFIVSKEMEIREGSDKISLMFTLPHEPGTLNNILGILAVHQMNMLRLESRPMPGKGWEYRFFVDVEGNLRDGELNSVLFEIVENTLTLGILGNYKKGA